MNLINQSWSLLFPESYENMVNKVVTASNQCYKDGHEFYGPLEDGERVVRSRIKAGHLSVIEHCTITAKIITNRAISHELVRHRLISVTQASTRYQNYASDKWSGLSFIIPNNMGLLNAGKYPDFDGDFMAHFPNIAEYAVLCANNYHGEVFNLSDIEMIWLYGRQLDVLEYNWYIKKGQCIPDNARGCLPNDLATSLVITANAREWRHIFELRAFNLTGRAHAQAQEIGKGLFALMKNTYPCFFDDMEYNNEQTDN